MPGADVRAVARAGKSPSQATELRFPSTDAADDVSGPGVFLAESTIPGATWVAVSIVVPSWPRQAGG